VGPRINCAAAPIPGQVQGASAAGSQLDDAPAQAHPHQGREAAAGRQRTATEAQANGEMSPDLSIPAVLKYASCPPEMSQHFGPDLAGHRILLRNGHVPGGRHGGPEDSRTRSDY